MNPWIRILTFYSLSRRIDVCKSRTSSIKTIPDLVMRHLVSQLLNRIEALVAENTAPFAIRTSGANLHATFTCIPCRVQLFGRPDTHTMGHIWGREWSATTGGQ